LLIDSSLHGYVELAKVSVIAAVVYNNPNLLSPDNEIAIGLY